MEVTPLPTTQANLFSHSSHHNLHSGSFTMPSSSEHSPLQTTSPVELKRKVSPRSSPSHPYSVPLSNLPNSLSTQHSIPSTNSITNKPQNQTSAMCSSNSQNNISPNSKLDASIKKQSSYPPVSKIRSSLKKAISSKDEHRISIIFKGFSQGRLRRDPESFQLLASYFREVGKISYAEICDNSAKSDLNSNTTHMDMDRQNSYKSKSEMKPSVNKRKHGIERISLDDDVIMSDVNNVEQPEISTKTKSENISQVNVKDEVDIVKNSSTIYGDNRSRTQNNRNKQIEMEKPEVDEYPDMAISLKNKLHDSTNRFFVQLSEAPKWKTFRRDDDMICQLTVHVILPHRIQDKNRNTFFAEKQSRICQNEKDKEIKATHRAENRAAKCIYDALEHMTKTIVDSAEASFNKGLKVVLQDWKQKDVKNSNERLQIMSRIDNAIRCATMPELYSARIYMYGSMTFGLATAASDIDIAINLPNEFRRNDESDKEKRRRHLRMLRHLCDKTALMGMRDAWVVDAKIPVLRCQDDNGNDIDLTICNRHAINMSKYIRAHLKDEEVWNVCIFIKHWAKRKQVVGVRQGFINSLGWTIMVIYFLHHVAVPRVGWLYRRNGNTVAKQKWKIDGGSGPPQQTSRLIAGFFYHFAYIFDYDNEAISANLQTAMSIEDITGYKASTPMFIENPCWEGENVVTHVTARGLRITIEEMKRAYFSCIREGNANELLEGREREENLFIR